MKIRIVALLGSLWVTHIGYAATNNQITQHVTFNHDTVLEILGQQIKKCTLREERFYLNGIRAETQAFNNGTTIYVVSYRYDGKTVDHLAQINISKSHSGAEVTVKDFPDVFNHSLGLAQTVPSWLHGNRACA
jgi:hypothetical protein